MSAKPLPREVEHTISTYMPRLPMQHWSTVADFTRTVVTSARPANRPIAVKMMYFVSRLAVWAWQTAGVDLTIPAVMRQSVIDRFVTDVHRHSAAATRSRAATMLSHIAGVVSGTERPRTDVKYAVSFGAPYLPSDEPWLRSWPDKQSTASRRRNAHGVLGLCRGAGLRRYEVELVRVRDVHVNATTPHVLVRGTRSRTAPINPAWARHLELVMVTAGDPEDFLLAPAATAARRSLMSEITSRPDAQGPQPHRLRSSWIVEWLHQAPAPYVLTIAGLTAFKALDIHLPYVTFGATAHGGEL
ncbi:hypothetical protein [Microcella sp.]|uniref:hypothetical protein n=1 Tax=Microcella sp. TaxID=1913979 RepID=UPI00391B44A2